MYSFLWRNTNRGGLPAFLNSMSAKPEESWLRPGPSSGVGSPAIVSPQELSARQDIVAPDGAPLPTSDHKHPSEDASFGPFVAAMALFGLSSAVRFFRRRILASTAFAVRFKVTAIIHPTSTLG
jgi:hypothetical protein